jgi:predicted lipid-binding transport protein (Tim44 family)
MKFLTMLAIVLGLGLSGFAMEAEAKRFGGGRSLGMKRQAAPPKAPASANAAQGTAGAAAAPKRSWMGPLAGIAAGLGLAALASHLGFGEGFGTILLLGLGVMAAIALFRMFAQKQGAARSGAAGQGMRYAHETPGAFSPNRPAAFEASNTTGHGSGSIIGSQLAGGSSAGPANIPADFDVAAFERNAKVNFIRLQAAYDAGDLDDLRQFTSPEVFAEIRMDLSDRKDAINKTEVIDIEAAVSEVVEEEGRYIVSVRFTGSVREDDAPTPEAVNEIWHMTKPTSGEGGWVVAGIQQTN